MLQMWKRAEKALHIIFKGKTKKWKCHVCLQEGKARIGQTDLEMEVLEQLKERHRLESPGCASSGAFSFSFKGVDQDDEIIAISSRRG